MLTLAKTTILNVDDHEAGRYARSRALRNAGFEVLEASSGAEALQLVNSQRPPLVLLDINLPDMTGYEVCRQIKSASATSGILVLHVSATFVKGSDQKRGLEGGADGYLAEPVDPDVLVATVNAYLRLRSAEEALRESEERFRAAFEDAPIGMALVNFDHRIFRANRALSEMLGYTPEELTTLSIDELGLPEEIEKSSLPLRQLFTGEIDGYQLERRCRNKKRRVIWVNLIGRAVRNADGKILYGLVMAENISERKRSEEAARCDCWPPSRKREAMPKQPIGPRTSFWQRFRTNCVRRWARFSAGPASYAIKRAILKRRPAVWKRLSATPRPRPSSSKTFWMSRELFRGNCV